MAIGVGELKEGVVAGSDKYERGQQYIKVRRRRGGLSKWEET
jgi:hypothetical protein